MEREINKLEKEIKKWQKEPKRAPANWKTEAELKLIELKKPAELKKEWLQLKDEVSSNISYLTKLHESPVVAMI